MKLERTIFKIAAVVLILAQGAAAYTANDTARKDIQSQVQQEINEERQQRGLEPLQNKSSLTKVANRHSTDMAHQLRLSHTDNLLETIRDSGTDCNAAAENVAYTYSIGRSNAEVADQLAEMWMESPGHKQNILSSEYDQTGIGVAQVGPYVMATQNFCG